MPSNNRLSKEGTRASKPKPSATESQAARMGKGKPTKGGHHGRSVAEHLPAEPVNPWDLQRGETAKAFAAFRLYLELGPDRTIQAAFAKSRGLAPGEKHIDGTFLDWSSKFSWVKRVLAYDAHMAAEYDRQVVAARTAEAAKWAKRQEDIREDEYTMAQRLKDVAGRMLDQPLIEAIADPNAKPEDVAKMVPANWKMSDAAKFLETFSKLGRLAAQMATDTQRRELTGADGGAIKTERSFDFDGLEDEDLDALERIMGKLAQPGGDPGGEGAPEASPGS